MAGKYAVKPLTENLFNSSSGAEARRNFAVISLLLCGLDYYHGAQARIAGAELVKDAVQLGTTDPSLLRLAETALDGAYLLINAGVISANTILLCRIWHRGLTKGFVSRDSSGTRRKLGKPDSPQVALATVLLTFAGQFGYASTIGSPDNGKEQQNKPKPSAVKPLTENK